MNKCSIDNMKAAAKELRDNGDIESADQLDGLVAEEVYNSKYESDIKMDLKPKAVSALRWFMKGDKKETDVVTIVDQEINIDGTTTVSYVSDGSSKVKYSRVDSNGFPVRNSKSGFEVRDMDRFVYSEPNDHSGYADIGKYKTILTKDWINDPNKLVDVAKYLKTIDTEPDSKHDDYLIDFIQNITNGMRNVIPDTEILIRKDNIGNGGKAIIGDDAKILLAVGQSKSPLSGGKTAVEVFAHELSHAAFEYALSRSENGELKNRLIKLRNQSMKHLKAIDLVSDHPINFEAEYTIAEERLKYMNTNLSEFMAYAVTNEKVMNILSDVDIRREKTEVVGLFNRIVETLLRLFDVFSARIKTDNKYMKADIEAMNLFKSLSNANNRAMEKIDNSVFAKVDDILSSAEESWKRFIDRQESKALQAALKSMPKKNASKMAKAKWVMLNLYQLATNVELDGEFSQILNMMGMKPEGTVQTLLRHLKKTDAYGELWQKMLMASLQIDKHREFQVQTVSNLVNNAFAGNLRNYEKEAMYYGVLKADMSALVDTYGIDGTTVLMGDKDARLAKIEGLKVAITSGSNNQREARYMVHQAVALGKSIVTDSSQMSQHRNAHDISMMKGTKYSKQMADNSMVKMVDTLASLTAIEHLDDNGSVVDTVSNIMSRDHDAVLNMIRMTNGGRDKRRSRNPSTYRKGYVREKYDGFVSFKFAKISDKGKLKKEGYTLKETIASSDMSPVAEDIGIYVSSLNQKQDMNRTTVRITDDREIGVGLHQIAMLSDKKMTNAIVKNTISRINVRLARDVESIMNGNTPKNHKSSMSIIYDEDGNVKDAIHGISDETKNKYLKLEKNSSDTIGRIYGHETDLEESAHLNKIAFEEMLYDMDENYIGTRFGKNRKEYIKISKHSTDKIAQEIYQSLSRDMKKNIDKKEVYDVDKNVVWSGGVHVRRDMMLDMFGVRDISIIDARVIREMPVAIKMIIKAIEETWKEIVSLFKIDVIIKTFSVLIGNIVSNIMYSIQMGHWPIEIAKLQIEGYKAISDYTRDQKEMATINALIDAGMATAEQIKDLERMEDNVTSNPAYKLLEAGLYQPIAEDVNMNDLKSSSRLINIMNDKLDGAPEFVKFGANWMVVSERTWLFQAVQTLTQKSDFVARYAQFELEKRKAMKRFNKKYNRRMTANEVSKLEDDLVVEMREVFINYTKPDSALMQYANDMGFAMFTKYTWRIQRVIKDGVAKRPLRFAMALIGQEFIEGMTGLEPDDIAEKSALLRGPTNLFFSPSVEDILRGALVPHGYRAAMEIAS